jgi:hypothetical protein
MSSSEATSKADLTFIVGDPRSRQNLSRIRAHASRAARKAPDDSGDVVAPCPIISHPGNFSEDARGHVLEDVGPSRPAQQTPDLHHRPWTLGEVADPNPVDIGSTEQSSGHIDSRELEAPLSAAPARTNPWTPSVLPTPIYRRFSTQGSTVGTWWELYPEAQGPAAGFHSFDPHKRCRISDLEIEAGVSSPRGVIQDIALDGPVVGCDQSEHLAQLLSPAMLPEPAHPPTTDEKDHLKTRKTALKLSKVKKSAQLKMQTRWRIGTGPAKALALPPEHPDTQFEYILHHSSNFYHQTFENVWQPLLQQNKAALDVQSDFEIFSESIFSAAALVEAGQPKKAATVIQCVVAMLHHLMHANHPQIYYTFMILSLETSTSALGQLRRQIRDHMLPICERMLGSDHPISAVLRMQVPMAARSFLHGKVMQQIQDCHHQIFGSDAYQTLAQQYVHARTLAEIGHVEESLDMFGNLIQSLERLLGINSLIVVYALFDKATTCLATTPPDTSILPELHISDALRRLQIIAQRNDKLLEDSLEAQKMEVAIVYTKIAGSRVLGKLHCARRNYGAAIQIFSQVVQYGLATLGPDAVPVHLAQADLDAAKVEELRRSMDAITIAGDGRPSTPSSGSDFHIANTAVGTIKSMNRCRMSSGQGSETIAEHKGLVVGYTVVGMPNMGHAPVL